MRNLVVDTDAIGRFGDAHAEMATQVAAAGSVDQAANLAAAVPVFGHFIADIAPALLFAQANHFESVAQLQGVHAGMAAAAYQASANHEAAEGASAARLSTSARL